MICSIFIFMYTYICNPLMTPVLIGMALFWRVKKPQRREHSQIQDIYIYIQYCLHYICRNNSQKSRICWISTSNQWVLQPYLWHVCFIKSGFQNLYKIQSSLAQPASNFFPIYSNAIWFTPILIKCDPKSHMAARNLAAHIRWTNPNLLGKWLGGAPLTLCVIPLFQWVSPLPKFQAFTGGSCGTAWGTQVTLLMTGVVGIEHLLAVLGVRNLWHHVLRQLKMGGKHFQDLPLVNGESPTYVYHGPPKPTFLEVFMVNNPAF